MLSLREWTLYWHKDPLLNVSHMRVRGPVLMPQETLLVIEKDRLLSVVHAVELILKDRTLRPSMALARLDALFLINEHFCSTCGRVHETSK